MVTSKTATAYGWAYTNSSATTATDYCISEWKSMLAECKSRAKVWANCWGDDDEGTGSLYKCYSGTATNSFKYQMVMDELAAVQAFINNSWVKYEYVPAEKIKTPAEKLRDIMQQRHAPAIIIAGTREPLQAPADFREICARQTIRRVLGEDDYRGYVKDGFVSVRAKSGLVYQIYPAHGITRVYRDGVMVERLCVVLKGDFPPTDSLIMRYLLILNDEMDFRKHAIKHQIIAPKAIHQKQSDSRSLVEIYKGLKVVA